MDKLKRLLQSRKFWALIASLVAIGSAVYTGTMPAEQAIQAVVAALAAYSIGTGLDNGNS